MVATFDNRCRHASPYATNRNSRHIRSSYVSLSVSLAFSRVALATRSTASDVPVFAAAAIVVFIVSVFVVFVVVVRGGGGDMGRIWTWRWSSGTRSAGRRSGHSMRVTPAESNVARSSRARDPRHPRPPGGRERPRRQDRRGRVGRDRYGGWGACRRDRRRC